jgi:hypothetical protein
MLIIFLCANCAPSNIRMSERLENLSRVEYIAPSEHHTMGVWRWEIVKETKEDDKHPLFVKLAGIFGENFSKQFSQKGFQLIPESRQGQFLRIDSWIGTPQGSWKFAKNSVAKTVGIRVMVHNCYNNDCKKIFDYEDSVLFPESYEEAGEILAKKIFDKINKLLF